ncbi:MAG: hypothetical protein HQL24_04325 [Candidatus Omnitrophica bacterium]|nr:hypothetical protein [Candidatus Omnitrophota bacterium]
MNRKSNYKKVVAILGILAILSPPGFSYAWEGGHRDHFYRYHEHPRFGMRIDLISRDYVPVVVGGASYYYYDGLYYVPGGAGYVLVTPPVGAIVSMIPPDYHSVIINGVTYYTDSGVYYVYTRYGYQVVPPPVVVARPVEVFAEPRNQTKVAEGAWLGGLMGAIIGGITGYQMKGNHAAGAALLGGVAGATAGGIIGAQIPNEEASRPVTVIQPAPAVVAPTPVVTTAPVAAAQPAPSTPQGSSEESFTINIPNNQGGYTPVVIKRSGNGFIGPQGEFYSLFPSVAQLKVMYVK